MAQVDKAKQGEYAAKLQASLERSRDNQLQKEADKRATAVGTPRLFPDQIRGMEVRVPKQIIIEPTSRCNLACLGCPIFLETGYEPGDMDVGYFKSIVDRVVTEGLDNTTLVLFFNGEPLIHPRYTEMVQYVVDRKVPAYITTNGTIWNQELFELVMQPNSIYQLIVSIDGLFEEWSNSIEIARPGTIRKVLWRNMNRLLELRDFYAPEGWQDAEAAGDHSVRHSHVDLATKMVARGQDFAEVEKYVDYWLGRGTSYVCVGRMLDGDVDSRQRIHPCQYFDPNFMCVRWDGRVVACAYNEGMSNEDKAQLGHLPQDGSLVEFYNNPSYQQIRWEQEQGIFKDPCDTCGFNYTGMGWDGTVKFRDQQFTQLPISYHRDYYNEFYSLFDRRRGSSFKQATAMTAAFKGAEDARILAAASAEAESA